jgi:hypothetical protein
MNSIITARAENIIKINFTLRNRQGTGILCTGTVRELHKLRFNTENSIITVENSIKNMQISEIKYILQPIPPSDS